GGCQSAGRKLCLIIRKYVALTCQSNWSVSHGSWLLHQGRRDDVAADLFVHPQTVRYRMGRLRELYGDRLHEPGTVLDLTVALAFPPGGDEGEPTDP
ncbi:helix-turn-helix domain-containing protein, partial [Micromonospora matsumotoense]|uniref:PucR family transcriptional regulator n=1 Tax=Micromonospora matsumotoense TaxID=121616 RepID=UPI0033FDA914